MLTTPRYLVGIDLGTTHSVVAYTRVDTAPDQIPAGPAALPDRPDVQLLPIEQLVAPGELGSQVLLPSFLFLPGPHDVPPGALALPWDPQIDYAVGEFARNRGAELPARLVASAKSWLAHRGVDRTQPILPWDAPTDVQRVSPLEASARYLLHIRNTWNAHFDGSGVRLEDQELYLTVPASFDAVARELTVQAAQMAGLANLTLLEEPQAAFYAWLEAQRERWRELVKVGETILVCDIGGGTSDFSLIQAAETDGSLELRRVAVGDHLLLGGDNMDLTLAYAVRAKLAQRGTQLDTWQFRGLVHSCRRAKERLLNDPNLPAEPVVILGRGSSLIGGTIRTELLREEIAEILLRGFFPIGAADEYPQQRQQVGLREMGLPYAADAAVTRHLAAFLARQLATSGEEQPVAFPSAVLFNGGVMNAAPLRAQVLQALRMWSTADVRELPAAQPDLAVALGAAYYGLARRGRGIRIRAGAARSYYVGIESTMPAVPGIPAPMSALCVVPFGMEEGTEADMREKEFGLVVGEPAVFHFLASAVRKADRPGEQIEDWSGELAKVATLETELPTGDGSLEGTLMPVWLQSRVTAVGTVELWCVARDSQQRWKLEFNVRKVDQASAVEEQAPGNQP